MSISLLNRYYLQKLIRQKTALTINIQGSNISFNVTQFQQHLNLGDLEKGAKDFQLDLLLKMHQNLSNNGNSNSEQLSDIEKKIFTLLGLRYDSFAYISLLNRLSELACKYLGKTMVTRYWKSSKPKESDLDIFEVTEEGNIVFKGSNNVNLSLEQQQKVQLWIETFISRCSLIIRDFKETIIQDNLSY